MADRIINNHQGTRIANALGKVAENVSDYTATQVTPTDAMKGELISESNAERIVDALDSIKDGAVDVAHGGTGAKTASAARSNLGLGALATLDSVSASEVSGLGTAATKDYTTSVSSGESKLVTSGAVYSALSNKMDKPSGSVGSASRPVYISNGEFVQANSYPSVPSISSSFTSDSTSVGASTDLVYLRFKRTQCPVELGTTASRAYSAGDFFIDNTGYLRYATSAISSGSSYSSKCTGTTWGGEVSSLKTFTTNLSTNVDTLLNLYNRMAISGTLPSSNWNNIRNTGLYSVTTLSNYTNTPSSKGAGNYGTLIVFGTHTNSGTYHHTVQAYCNSGVIYYRTAYDGNWHSWSKISAT